MPKVGGAPAQTPAPQTVPAPHAPIATPAEVAMSAAEPTMAQADSDLSARMQSMLAGAAAPAPMSGNGAPPQRDAGAAAAILATLQRTNWNDIQGGQFVVLPPGDYEAEIIKATETTSGSGNAMIKLEMSVLWPLEFVGTKVWDQCVLVPTSLWKLKTLLEATGLLDDEGRFTGEDLTTDLREWAVSFNIINEEYAPPGGQKRNTHKVAGGYGRAHRAPNLEVQEEAAGSPALQAGQANGGVDWTPPQ